MSAKIENIPQKNQKYVVDIVDYGANGEGVAKINDFVVFVPFAIIGEQVEIQIKLSKKQFAIGKIVKIIKQSPKRVEPKCKYFSKCGGCDLQHIEYDEQLNIKTNMVKTALNKYAKVACDVQKCVASPKQYNYRNKFAFPLMTKEGKLCAGMYRVASHNIVEIDDCEIQEDCRFVLNSFLEFANSEGYVAYDETTKSGLKHLVVRNNDDGILVCVVSAEKLHNLQILAQKLQQKYKKVHIINNINTLNNNVILGKKDYIVCGTGELEFEEFGIKYQVNAHSFLQVNAGIKKMLYEKVLDNIGANDVVIDAYSGAGVLSGMIARKCKQVFGIEIVKEAVADAEKLKKDNNIENLVNVCGDCAAELPKIAQKSKANVVVLDPPRKGCDKKVIESLIESEIEKIVYVSCNPATLARDLGYLAEKYKIELVQPYDMFAQTANVETLVVLSKIAKLA